MSYNNAVWISPTALKNYQDCPYKYLGVNVLKMKEPPNPNMEFGIFIHNAMERAGHKIMGNQSCAMDVLKEIQVPDSFNDLQRMTFKQIVDEIDSNYLNVFSYHTIAVEKFIDKIPIRENTFLTAKIDREDWQIGIVDESGTPGDDTVTCVDYKTGKVDERFLDKDFQFIIYSKYMMTRYPNVQNKIVKFISFKDGNVNVVPKEASLKNFGIVETLTDQILAEKKYDPCTNKMCDWCYFKKSGSCPLFDNGKDFRPDSIKTKPSVVTQPATTNDNCVETQDAFGIGLAPAKSETNTTIEKLQQLYEKELFPGLTIKCGVTTFGKKKYTEAFMARCKDFIVNKLITYRGD